MKIKAIIMDIDGTLIGKRERGKVTKKNKEALLKAQQQGIKLILASGRPLNSMIHIAKQIDMDKHNGLCVCFNGAKVVDVTTNEVLFNQVMSRDLSKRILNHMKNFNVRPLIVNGDYAYVTDVYQHMVKINDKKDAPEINIIAHEAHDNGYMLCEVKDLEEFCDFPLNKILNIGDPAYLKEHYEQMYAPFIDEANAMFTAPFYYEFTDKGIDKVKALEAVLKPLDIKPNECIAFGDAQNDMTMLQFAGIGVAMENAVDEVKAIADEITTSCDEGGIANSLYQHIHI